MIKKEETIAFSPFEKNISDSDNFIIFKGTNILVIKNKPIIEIPKFIDLKLLRNKLGNYLYIGDLSDNSFYCAELSNDSTLPSTLEWINFTDERWEIDNSLYFTVIKSYQLLCWHKASKYCGSCGSPTNIKSNEKAKQCPTCQRIEYPRICPAIIVGIKKDNTILLAHNAKFPDGFYSIIAGFVEQGETLEQAVEREVYEEVGIKIKNITYFSSRPYTSDNSLMIGFTAQYDSGEIKVDNKEITAADWFSKDSLPPLLPSKLTISRSIIDFLFSNIF